MPIKNSGNVNLPQTTLAVTLVNPLYGAPDNAISHGTNFASWTVDAGSQKDSTGVTVKQNSTSDLVYVDVAGLAASTTYWAMIMLASKSAGVTGGNGLSVVASGTSGSNFTAVAGGAIDLSAAVVGVPYYFKIKTDSSTGPWRLAIVHNGSSANETVKFSDIRIYPIPSRSSAKVAVVGDRAGGFAAQYASLTNAAIISATADTKNVIVVGDQADASNTFAACDCVQFASCVTTNANAVVTAPAGTFTDLVAGVGITGTGIPASTTVLSVDSATQITLSANATASGTVTLTCTSVLKTVIASRGGERYNTMGNHDYDGARETEIISYFPNGALATNNNSSKGYYSKVLGEMEFFFVNDNDSASGNAGQELTDNAGGISATRVNFQASTAMQWIIAKIAASTAKWKIVMIHHPAWTSSSTGPFTSNQFDWKTLGAHMVLQSHDHGVERIYKNGVYWFTVAMGGGNHHGWATALAETEFRIDSTRTASFATTYGYLKFSDSTTALILEYFDSSHQLMDRAKIAQP